MMPQLCIRLNFVLAKVPWTQSLSAMLITLLWDSLWETLICLFLAICEYPENPFDLVHALRNPLKVAVGGCHCP